jgi:ABC-type nitrate/sulfonate/bicarbonate transport system permease component
MQKTRLESLPVSRVRDTSEVIAGRPGAPSGLVVALGLVLAVFLVWELLTRLLAVPVYILPAPSRILQTLAQNGQVYLEASLLTLGEAALGLVLGATAGTGIALLLGLWPRLEQGVMTLAILIKSTPLVAVAPLLTIWLGFGVLPKIIITGLLTFFPVLVNMLSGLNTADPARLDTLRSWHASRWELLRFVRLPESLPYFFAALKVSGPLALIGAVVAEWTGASGGLGRLMWLAYTNLNLPYLFSAVFILSTAGILIYSGIQWVERKLVFWEG